MVGHDRVTIRLESDLDFGKIVFANNSVQIVVDIHRKKATQKLEGSSYNEIGLTL